MTRRQYLGVVVSSTYEDLKEHRAALMSAIQGQHLHAVAMESDSARPVTVVESSLEKVRDAAAYVAIISRRYGSVPECGTNPDALSLTHLEFREAVRLGLPILVFIMGSGHLLTEDGVELDPEKRRKLAEFREEAKFAGGEVHQVYKEFNDLAEFAASATQAVAELRRVLDVPVLEPVVEADDHIPAAPALYAKPRYLGSHDFVGREAQLETLNDWARPAGQHSVLLFEAIGGSGKSILTWEWATRHALGVRGDWAGRFWYSFYEAGAVMSDFCRRALAYMTGKPVKAFAGKRQAELTELLVSELEARPWLLVLDGLERVLVAYHRVDAAQVSDENAGGSDEIAHRDPCAAIRPEDEELLRHLAGASPSRILITSRLVPRVLLNPSSQAIPGVLHERLPGLRPAEAEALLRACGVTGASAAMRSFLQRHCDCHPLVTGIVAGLVNEYLPARGDFDRWSADLEHGGSLEVGQLDLVQKRNHVLYTAIGVLPDGSRQLLSTLALLPYAVDYRTLNALSPHRESTTAARDLTSTVSDLERRGLLQHDRSTGQYDLHPVVRAVAAAKLESGDRELLGTRVVDYFSTRTTSRYGEVSSLEEVRDDLTLVRTLLQIGRLKAAADFWFAGLQSVLVEQLEARSEMLSLLRPFFGSTWSSPVAELPDGDVANLVNSIAGCMYSNGDLEQAQEVCEVALRLSITGNEPDETVVNLSNLALVVSQRNRLASSRRLIWLNIELAESDGRVANVLRARRAAFVWLARAGWVEDAEEMWQTLPRIAGQGDLAKPLCYAALDRAWFDFEKGVLTAKDLDRVETEGREHGYRYVVRTALKLRGLWRAERGEWARSAAELSEAVRMGREVGVHDARAEAGLALTQLHLGELREPAQVAARLAGERECADGALARLWLEIGDVEQARKHALAAYRWAWADGEPYTWGFNLERARRLLVELGADIPVLPAYDPAADAEFPWEADVRAFMDTLRE
ncbi:DUF4062 domain-containing protein [Lentzea alba]|uniref:DUF4062 domain-containing protein n=1 Tax=Lentzea alba TaxID=2714351 RepID=UPI0039BFAB65